MSFILQLRPDLEENLRSQARSLGVSIEEYLQSLLEKQAVLQQYQPKLTLEEFEAELDGLTEFADKIPDLPLEALNRESIYRDHD
jgi:hypothetical protein